jgi:hypothetical protein
MDFADNKTYTGSFDTYGGLGKNNGSPGTSFVKTSDGNFNKKESACFHFHQS